MSDAEEDRPQTPTNPTGSMDRRLGWVLVVTVAAYGVLVLAIDRPTPAPRVTVPYTPTFLEQVTAGNVRSISATGATVEGELRKALR